MGFENKLQGQYTPPLQRGVHIYRLLVAGWYPKKIAKQVNCSTALVWKYAHKYEREGKVERACKYPAMWRIKRTDIHPDMAGGTYTPIQPILIPHRLGGCFRLIGKPKLPYDKGGFATIKDPSYTARFGRSKAIVWLKSFIGATVEEQISNGRQAILALGNKLEQEHGLTLTFERWYEGIDWVISDKKAGRLLGEVADLKAAPKTIGGAEMVFDDGTHKDQLEIRPAIGQPLLKSSEVAKTLEYLITKAPLTLMDIDKRLTMQEAAFKNVEIYNENIVKHLAVLDKMSITLDKICEGLGKK